MDWQPIETAPKDGTVIDLWINGARWTDCWWQVGNRLHPLDGWYSDALDCGDADWFCDDQQPTHWMPLPAPPHEGPVFQFLPGDEVQYIFAMPGPDTFPVTVVEDDGGPTIVIMEGEGLYGAGPRTKRREVRRTSILWMKDGPVGKRFREWKAAQGVKPER